MDAREFFDRVEAHPELEGLGIEDGDESAPPAGATAPAVLVRHAPTDAKFRVELASVAGESWETLEAILTGRRDARVLRQMTRIVGYYSQVGNWNRSKLGELRDRQAGDYAVAKGAPSPAGKAQAK